MRRTIPAVAALGLLVGIVLAGCSLLRFPPSVDFEASVTEGPTPLVVAFDPVVEGATSYRWSFGDGETSDAVAPVHVYRTAGTYTVSLTAEFVDGTVATAERKDLVTVLPLDGKEEVRYVYWIEVSTGTIWRGPRSGGERERAIRGGVGTTAFDVADGWIYWADQVGWAIYRARLDGSDQQTLLTEQRYVTAIVAVPERNAICWVRWPFASGGTAGNQYGGVFRASLDALEPVTLKSYGPDADPFANGLDVDIVGKKIWWSTCHFSESGWSECTESIMATSFLGIGRESVVSGLCMKGNIELDTIPGFGAEHVYWIGPFLGTDAINRCNVDGTNRTELLRDASLSGWIAVDRVEGKIYFTTHNGIERCDLDGTNREFLFEEDAMMGIVLPH